MDFDLQQIDEETVEAIESSIEEIQERENSTLVNIAGQVLFNGTTETVNHKEKTFLTKQEALLTDNSGSLRMVLWEQDIKKFKSGQCYILSNVAIKEFNDAEYLTLTRFSTVNETDKLTVTRQDDVPDINKKQMKVTFPPDGINYVQLYLSCNKCHSKFSDSDTKIVKYSECGIMQLKTKCPKPQCLLFSVVEYSLDLFPSILNSMKVSFDRKRRNTLSYALVSSIIIGYIIITMYEVVYKPSSEQVSE